MNTTQTSTRENGFHEGDLVLWHETQGARAIPIPAVVVRQDDDSVVIKARISGTVKELHVEPEQLEER